MDLIDLGAAEHYIGIYHNVARNCPTCAGFGASSAIRSPYLVEIFENEYRNDTPDTSGSTGVAVAFNGASQSYHTVRIYGNRLDGQNYAVQVASNGHAGCAIPEAEIYDNSLYNFNHGPGVSTDNAVTITHSRFQRNYGYNPIGLIGLPFGAGVITPVNNGGANTAAPAPSTPYAVETTDVLITSTGGTGVAITVEDAAGNTLYSGSTLAQFFVPLGYVVNWGGFSGAPAVSVYAT
jgi:hypothetical protein